MKQITIFFMAAMFLMSCSAGKKRPQARRYPGSHIISNDKRVVKDNLRYKKEHAKASRKKREDLAIYLHHNNITTTNKSTRKSRKENH